MCMSRAEYPFKEMGGGLRGRLLLAKVRETVQIKPRHRKSQLRFAQLPL